jgi:hypothetical protein
MSATDTEVRLSLSNIVIEVTYQGVVVERDDGVRRAFPSSEWALVLKAAWVAQNDRDTESCGVPVPELGEDASVVLAFDDGLGYEDADCLELHLDDDGPLFSLDLRTWRLVTDVTSSVLGLNGR